MITIGIEGNNPGKIPISNSLFRGEIAREELQSLVELNRDRDEYLQHNGYKLFRSKAWGYRAIFLILHNYSQLYMLHTVESMLRRWCRGRGFDTTKYIQSVTQRLRCSPSTFVDTTDRDFMITMVSSISRIENGVPSIMADVSVGWELFTQRFTSYQEA